VTFGELHHVVEAASDRRLSTRYPVYELHPGFLPFSRRSRSLLQRQERVFAALRQLGWPVFLRVAEIPTGAEQPAGWSLVARDTWAVPREVGSAQLLDAQLRAGDWQLYLSEEAVDPSTLPHLFRDPIAEAFTVVEAVGVPALLDSANGNTEWRVLLQPAVEEKRAAA
jgi:hypothetical protein